MYSISVGIEAAGLKMVKTNRDAFSRSRMTFYRVKALFKVKVFYSLTILLIYFSSPAHPYFMRNCSSITYHSFWLRMDVVCRTVDLQSELMQEF